VTAGPFPHDHRHFLPGVTAAEWETMLGYLRETRYPAGTRLYEPGGADRLLADRALTFLRSGRVGVLPVDYDMEIGIAPPAVLGRAAFFTGETLFFRESVVLEDCDTLVLTRDAFVRLSAEHPRLALHLAMDTASELALTVSARTDALLQRGIQLPEDAGREDDRV